VETAVELSVFPLLNRDFQHDIGYPLLRHQHDWQLNGNARRGQACNQSEQSEPFHDKELTGLPPRKSRTKLDWL
jgi:hypothetical protein